MSSGRPQKVLFVHDGPVYKDNNNKFYGLHYNNKLVERYMLLGNEVTFMMRVSALTEVPDGKFSLIDHPNFTVAEFPNLKTLKGRFVKKALANKIAEEEVSSSDIIVARLPSSSGNLAVKHALRLNKPLIVEFVACGWDAYWNYNWKGKLVAPYFFIKQKLRMQKVPYVMYVTNKFLQGRYPTKGKAAAISDVELPSPDPSVLEKRIERIRNNRNQPLTMATVAALDVPYKGQADVIRAMAGLKRKGIAIRYNLVGQGDPSALKKLIDQLELNDVVKIIGPLQHTEVFPFLDETDIYIQPSKVEGMPRAVIEAMSRGCAVLGSDKGGIPELIDKQFVFKPGSPSSIMDKLEDVNRDVLAQCAVNNIDRAMDYARETLSMKRKQFYSEFLRNHNMNSF